MCVDIMSVDIVDIVCVDIVYGMYLVTSSASLQGSAA